MVSIAHNTLTPVRIGKRILTAKTTIKIMEGKKNMIYLVVQESNIDGAIIYDIVPRTTLAKAREVVKEKRAFILKEHIKFGGVDNWKEEFEYEDKPDEFFINTPTDDYYESIHIERRELI